MKFLMFNLVVAGALVYLFTADRADVHAAADRVYETADGIKSAARDAVGKGRELLQGDQAAESRPAPSPKPIQKPAPEASPVAPTVKQVAQSNIPRPVPPEVARRRDEVMGTALAAPVARAAPGQPNIPELKQGEKFMSPAQRQKELFSLAEEMELLYARKISQ
jgi:hypothetical protein